MHASLIGDILLFIISTLCASGSTNVTKCRLANNVAKDKPT